MSEMDTDTERGGAGAPHFTKELKNFKVPEGKSITLSARVNGSPRPNVRSYQRTCILRGHSFSVTIFMLMPNCFVFSSGCLKHA